MTLFLRVLRPHTAEHVTTVTCPGYYDMGMMCYVIAMPPECILAPAGKLHSGDCLTEFDNLGQETISWCPTQVSTVLYCIIVLAVSKHRT